MGHTVQAFEIHAKLPGLNEYTGANRANRYGAGKLKSSTERVIILRAKAARPRLRKIKRPCFFTFTWYEATRRRDKDNVAFAKKFIFDALQKSGILPNDNNDYVVGFADRFVYGSGQKVLVEIRECDGAE